jgi:uncharacterized protein YxjI
MREARPGSRVGRIGNPSYFRPGEKGMLERQRFLIKEQVAVLKTVDTYDIFNPDTGEQVGVAREVPGSWVTLLRWFISKHLMPTTVEVREIEDESLLFTIRRPVRFWRQQVEVYDADDHLVGFFKSKLFTLGGGFWVYDNRGEQFAEVQGNWIGWNFTFLTPDGRELGIVTKKWAGLGKELFTSADNYIVSIHDDLLNEPIAKMLLLAAALAIDIVYYEENG